MWIILVLVGNLSIKGTACNIIALMPKLQETTMNQKEYQPF
jgi:hypothetical protein